MVTALTLPFGHYCLSERSPHFLTLLQLLLIRGAMISLSYIARTSASKLHPDRACIFIFLPLFSRFILAPPHFSPERRVQSNRREKYIYFRDPANWSIIRIILVNSSLERITFDRKLSASRAIQFTNALYIGCDRK